MNYQLTSLSSQRSAAAHPPVLDVYTLVKFDPEKKEACSICLDDLSESDLIARLNVCAHLLHETCINEHIARDNTLCPTCRKTITVLSPERQFEKDFEAQVESDRRNQSAVIEAQLDDILGALPANRSIHLIDQAFIANFFNTMRRLGIDQGQKFEIWAAYVERIQGQLQMQPQVLRVFLEALERNRADITTQIEASNNPPRAPARPAPAPVPVHHRAPQVAPPIAVVHRPPVAVVHRPLAAVAADPVGMARAYQAARSDDTICLKAAFLCTSVAVAAIAFRLLS